MAKNFISDLSITASNNTDMAGNGIAGTDSVSGGDNVIRALAAMLAMAYDDAGGLGTVGGTGDAITLTAKQAWTGYGTSANQIDSGTTVAFKAGAANTGAATINVNSLGAKKIRGQGDTALSANDILEKGIYLLRYDSAYDSAAGAWVLLNPSVSTSSYQPLSANLTALSTAFTAASASGPATLAFPEDTDNGANKVTVTAPASVASDAVVTLPSSTGTLALTSDIPAGGAAMLIRATDSSIASTSAATDSTLQFSMLANTTYRIRIWGSYTQVNGTGADLEISFTGPASPTLVRGYSNTAPSNNPPVNTQSFFTSYAAAAITLDGSTAQPNGYFEFDMLVQNGANAGTFGIRFAVNSTTGSGSCTIRAGSSLEYKAA